MSLKKYLVSDNIIYVNFSAYLIEKGKLCKHKQLWGIESEAKCKEAAINHNLTWGGPVSYDHSPSCIYFTWKNPENTWQMRAVFYNTKIKDHSRFAYMGADVSALCEGIILYKFSLM